VHSTEFCGKFCRLASSFIMTIISRVAKLVMTEPR
jgi:hypothetical protein